ncbi:MAG TPA: class I SAM-dependent rRNA methyltransferase [Candidatus Omnitrophota bacterium]|nr:class I SAM-dependent rRNA methyltransferase [Candidatus Omnitrophota bacterium]
MKEVKVILKESREKPVLAFHPWIYSGAIDLIEDDFKAGDVVRVHSAKGNFLGKGYLNPHSEIAIRMLTFQDEAIDETFFKEKFGMAFRLRAGIPEAGTNACRLVNGEGDFLPGLVVDRYDRYLVIQVLTAGMEKLKPCWLGCLKDLEGIRGIYQKDDSERRRFEGLDRCVETVCGEEPPAFIEIRERGMKFIVDVKEGQKTGFFLDQRENRHLARRIAGGKNVLNAFAYTGGFSVACLLGGAKRVTSVESSEAALNACASNFELNGQDPKDHVFAREDVFDYLRQDPVRYDLIVLDPPAFAKSKSDVEKAARGYKDINLQAMKRLNPGGLLFTFSCSNYISPELFQKIVFGAAKDARVRLQIIEKTSHPSDHPISVFHPEGEYLKGLLCRVA